MSSPPPLHQQNKLRRLEQLYGKLKRPLAAIGYVFPGSIAKRFMPCGKSSCRCATDPSRRHGPYYEWSRKVGGKTVTVRLTADQARLYAGWIDNRRKFKKIMARMQTVSIQVARVLADTRLPR